MRSSEIKSDDIGSDSIRSNDIGSDSDITGLLKAWEQGDQEALDRLTPLVYKELRRLATSHMRRERQGHTLAPTALVHEVFLRLVRQRRIHWHSRAQLFALTSTMMRRILIDYARGRQVALGGRGGFSLEQLHLDKAVIRAPELIALDDALRELAKVDPMQSRLVELRYFCGLTVEETAEALGVTGRTVKRRWRSAKLWLLRHLRAEEAHGY